MANNTGYMKNHLHYCRTSQWAWSVRACVRAVTHFHSDVEMFGIWFKVDNKNEKPQVKIII